MALLGSSTACRMLPPVNQHACLHGRSAVLRGDMTLSTYVCCRECGINMELDQVPVHSLVPAALQNIESVADFMQMLPEHDDDMAAQLADAEAHNECLRFVGAPAWLQPPTDRTAEPVVLPCWLPAYELRGVLLQRARLCRALPSQLHLLQTSTAVAEQEPACDIMIMGHGHAIICFIQINYCVQGWWTAKQALAASSSNATQRATPLRS